MLQNLPHFWHEFLKETLRKSCNEKRGENVLPFEAFYYIISSSTSILFLKSAVLYRLTREIHLKVNYCFYVVLSYRWPKKSFFAKIANLHTNTHTKKIPINLKLDVDSSSTFSIFPSNIFPNYFRIQ